MCGVAANPSCVGTTYYVHKAQGGLMTLGEEVGVGLPFSTVAMEGKLLRKSG